MKLMVLQGGGPTPVLNTSLFGVLDEARRAGAKQILGSRFGIEGLLKENFVDLTNAPIDFLKRTPGAALGSTRFKPSEEDFRKVVQRLRERGIDHLILIGGNGSQRGAAAIAQAAAELHPDLRVIGAPKTIDNDIFQTDRCPGFGSAARYIAQATQDLAADVRSLPQPVSILETMGRGVGWVAAAAALGKRDENDAPHLVYIPEKPFETPKFLAALDRVVKKLGYAIVVVSEGLVKADGSPVFENTHSHQRDALGRALPGGVGTFLSETVAKELNIRCRMEKPGLCGRASMLHVSPQDAADAELTGREAVRAALAGATAKMVSLLPIGSEKKFELIDVTHLKGDRAIPENWLTNDAIPVNRDFLTYTRAIAGDIHPHEEFSAK